MANTERKSETGASLKRFTLVDLFAGCGGLSLGLEQAGFRPILFSEINVSAAETYIANRPGTEALWVRDIRDLTDLSKPNNLRSYWIPRWQQEGITDVDLVAGGPPCQGYSGIGHRRSFQVEKHKIPSNHLYQQMIEVIKIIRPKMFLFENVWGITFGRWTAGGEKGEIWSQVKAAFRIDGYIVPEPDAKPIECGRYGVPQKRPRVLIAGIRSDCAPFFKRQNGAPAEGLLPAPKEGAHPPNIIDVLGDLVDESYLDRQVTPSYPAPARSRAAQYFRRRHDGSIARKGDPVTEHEYSQHRPKTLERFQYMLNPDKHVKKKWMKTKKFAQRVLPAQWGAKGPNITVTSLPDDFVHFSQPRILTVREWARLQTFPDWYEFRGPRTTGGHRRAGIPTQGVWDREVPRYTQIGNAVPVALAFEIGNHFASILGKKNAEPSPASIVDKELILV